ncbi:hypothetical protein CH341_12795 [Rhodoplanes roseus]|uniref:HTH lysR-type domain-containing protein n=2 Tax=Rhodoplanes roseus TaxID=29409 RepID=A0A327L1M4_9BRAD|nr:hypothetical protein CH341_12795 [Rhodoplanes roseus]
MSGVYSQSLIQSFLPVMSVDFRDLRYFLKIADLGHIGRAAEALHVTQPALSKCITRLEDGYRVRLFERAGRGIVLTEAGQRLAERLRVVEHDLQDIRREVSELGRGVAGLVRVGCAGSIASFVIPKICRILREQAPQIHLLIDVALDVVLQDALRNGALDVTVSPARLTTANDGIATTPLFADTVVVVGRSGHPLSRKTATLKEMSKYGWVLPLPSVSTRRWLEKVFLQSDLPPPEAVVTTRLLLSAPKILVETDLLAFVSRLNIGSGRDNRGIVEIPNVQTTMERTMDIGCRANAYLSPATRYFIDVLQKHGPDVSASDRTHCG